MTSEQRIVFYMRLPVLVLVCLCLEVRAFWPAASLLQPQYRPRTAVIRGAVPGVIPPTWIADEDDLRRSPRRGVVVPQVGAGV